VNTLLVPDRHLADVWQHFQGAEAIGGDLWYSRMARYRSHIGVDTGVAHLQNLVVPKRKHRCGRETLFRRQLALDFQELGGSPPTLNQLKRRSSS
jgi:hypothetical protein